MRGGTGRGWALAALALALSGCMYSLDIEGKRCDDTRHCPIGYACVPGDGGSYCLRGTDGGTDGGDTGPCVEGQKACFPSNPLSVFECSGGEWEPTACESGKYCFYTAAEGNDVGCVAECAVSADCLRATHYCNPENHHCEPKGNCTPPGETHCQFLPQGDILETCDPDSRFWRQTECGPGGYCHDRYLKCLIKCSTDEDCDNLPNAEQPEPNSCDLSSRRCRFLEFCENANDCVAGQEACVEREGFGGVCVGNPQSVAICNMSDCNMGCFSVTDDTGVAGTCNLEGFVTDFVSSSVLPKTTTTVNLWLEVHRREAVLSGDLYSPLSTCSVEQANPGTDNNGFYRMANIPTKTALVFLVHGGPGTGAEFVDTFTFGYYLRADDCEQAGGRLEMTVPVIRKSYYEDVYNGGLLAGVTPNPSKGLILARISDCTPNRIKGAKVSTSIPSQQEYYCNSTQPDVNATQTYDIGFYGAANADAIRGVLGVAIKDSGSTFMYLGPYPIRVFPGSATLLIVQKPREP